MSYALKTFGSSIGRMLLPDRKRAPTTALSLVLLGVFLGTPASSAAPRSSSPPVFAIIELQAGNLPHLALTRVVPRTLEPQGPRLDLGQCNLPRPDTAWARSPNGKLLAANLCPNGLPQLFVIEIETMRIVSVLPVTASMLIWPTPRRLIAIDEYQMKATVFDPVTQFVPSQFSLVREGGGELFEPSRTRDGAALLLGELGKPLRVLRVGPKASRPIVLRNLWWGLESRPANADDNLPPLARTALDRARDDLARRENLPPSSIQDIALIPNVWPTTRMGCPAQINYPTQTSGYRVLLGARERWFDYRVSLRGGFIFCAEGPPGSAPRRNLLQAPRGATQISSAALAVDRRRGFAFIISPEGPIVAVQLAKRTVRVRRFLTSIQGDPDYETEPHARWVKGDTIALSLEWPGGSMGLMLINAKTGRSRVVSRFPCTFTVHRQLILFHAPWWYGRQCGPVTAYRRDGETLWIAPDWASLQVAGDYGYARLVDEWNQPEGVNVIDLSRGVVVTHKPGSRTVVLGESR